MMAGWLFSPGAQGQLLPKDRLAGPTAWLMAIMLFVTVVVAAAGLALAHGAALAKRGVEHRYSVELDDGSRSGAALAARLRAVGGITTATPVAEEELRATLESWLGPLAHSDALPLPAMVDVTLAPGADAGRVKAEVGRAAPGARFIANEARLGPVLRVVTMIGWLALGLVVLMALAAAAVVLLATRGAFDTHRQTLEIMHGVGATDRQVTRLFMRQMAIEALVGGVAGTVAAGVVLGLLVGGGTALSGALGGADLLGWRDALLLAALPLLGALMAMLVARRTVLGALRETL